jgi:cytochrome c oxidase cbb3-type subunit 1
LGWVAFVSIGAIYYMIPRLVGKEKMYSTKLIEIHFWVATLAIVLYIASMWISGVMQGLMWRAVNADGTLTYSFVESVKSSYPFWLIRFIGGAMYLGSMFIMAYNVYMTVRGAKVVKPSVPAPAAGAALAA